jgi:hypothetical protein
MSANLDLVRSIYAAWERGGSSLVEWAQPEIEFVIADGPTPGSWSGRAAMTDAWRDFLRAWEEFRPRLISTASSTANASWCSSSSAGAARRAGWRSGRSGQRERTYGTFGAAKRGESFSTWIASARSPTSVSLRRANEDSADSADSASERCKCFACKGGGIAGGVAGRRSAASAAG